MLGIHRKESFHSNESDTAMIIIEHTFRLLSRHHQLR